MLLKSTVHAKATVPQTYVTYELYWNQNIRRPEFDVYFVNTP
jgi:hypothetical protein